MLAWRLWRRGQPSRARKVGAYASRFRRVLALPSLLPHVAAAFCSTTKYHSPLPRPPQGSLWTDEYLEERAGSAHVRVEARLSRALKPWARVSRRCRLQPAPAFPHLHLCGTLYLQVRPSSEAGFGAGRYDPMPFRSFMERFRAGDEVRSKPRHTHLGSVLQTTHAVLPDRASWTSRPHLCCVDPPQMLYLTTEATKMDRHGRLVRPPCFCWPTSVAAELW